MRRIKSKPDNKANEKLRAEKMAEEVELLKQFDPDKELKEEFEIASLIDLQKYLDE